MCLCLCLYLALASLTGNCQKHENDVNMWALTLWWDFEKQVIEMTSHWKVPWFSKNNPCWKIYSCKSFQFWRGKGEGASRTFLLYGRDLQPHDMGGVRGCRGGGGANEKNAKFRLTVWLTPRYPSSQLSVGNITITVSALTKTTTTTTYIWPYSWM